MGLKANRGDSKELEVRSCLAKRLQNFKKKRDIPMG